MNEVFQGAKVRSSKHLALPVIALAASALCASAEVAQAAPKQIVVVVAEGLSPQVIELGSSYIKSASTEVETTIGFSDLKAAAKSAKVSGNVVASMRGILKTAEANGYKTGLVTTNDVTSDAAAFYDIPASTTDIAASLIKDSGFDFLAGGGRLKFVPTTGVNPTTAFKASGNTVLTTADAFENVEEVKGRVLALQADNELSYALDADPAAETGLGDLASLAMTTLGGDDANTPYFLVIHDANLLKALNTKDTPAVFGEFRELDGIVTEALSVRDSKDTPADMGLAVFSTGAASVPAYTTTVPNDRSNAIFVTTKLPSSYAKTTMTLKGATDESVTAFATEYGTWEVGSDARAGIIAGTMTGEEAVRASFEPAIAIAFEAKDVSPMAYVVGIDSADPIANLAKIAGTKAK